MGVDVYGIGNALVDTEVTVSFEDLKTLGIAPGLMTLIDEATHERLSKALQQVVTQKAAGGSAANTIFLASQLGCNTAYSCRVGDDDLGKFVLDEFTLFNIETNLNQSNLVSGARTGQCFVLITPDHDRTLNTFLGVTSQFCKDDLIEDRLKESGYLYMEGYLAAQPIAVEAAVYAHQVAKASGVKTIMGLSDPNITKFFRGGLKQMMGDGLDLLFCNHAEAMEFTDTQSVSDAMQALKLLSNKVVITLGADGVLVWDTKKEIKVDAMPTEVVDTNGAGDAFAGGYIAAICQGKSDEEAAYWGNVSAGKVISQYGPRLSYSAFEDVKAMLG